MPRSLRSCIFIIAAIFLGSICVFAIGPRAASINVDASQPMNDFIKAHVALQAAVSSSGSAVETRTFGIPSILIYAPTGQLVYFGSNDNEEHLEKNFAMLQGLPVSAQNLQTITNMPALADMLDIVPAFKSAKGKILGDGHYVVYVVTMALEQVTRTQQAVIDLGNRSKNLPIDTLLLRLQQ